jgi:hypothetical protein
MSFRSVTTLDTGRFFASPRREAPAPMISAKRRIVDFMLIDADVSSDVPEA